MVWVSPGGNSDRGLSFLFSTDLQYFGFLAVQILRGLSFGLSFLISWGWGWFPHRQLSRTSSPFWVAMAWTPYRSHWTPSGPKPPPKVEKRFPGASRPRGRKGWTIKLKGWKVKRVWIDSFSTRFRLFPTLFDPETKRPRQTFSLELVKDFWPEGPE